ncbi:MAG TPA: aminotransferase class III-fold pyridoxal phosphate-dependent enzyme [Xanthobacteraceae bacterium]|jgi:glutamate-1-semialdehyde 2,1-aminomutase|nr:aminotransferase class III-fold pyridoxal phosphate-dependent enzyme [Xanthobacteraceae bacterium]
MGSLSLAFYGLGAAAVATSVATLKKRLELSQAKHKSLAGHSRLARRLAGFVPFYDYGDERFFCSDGAPADVAARRRAGFERLSTLYKTRFAETIRRTAEASEAISDLKFTDTYRVPFQYRRKIAADLPSTALIQSSSGVTLTDLDGNRFYDLSGSYGINVLGCDFYKAAIDRGIARVRDLGPVLGPYHPVIIENTKLLREISGLDEVSFHMSGTEAVMQAVRLARYHTRRSHLVRFCGAYHGWWGDVQPGIGNPVPAHETYTLPEMSEETLRVLRRRRNIACVLVNPLQSLHVNASDATDSALIDSSRAAHFDHEAYTEWLKRLRAVCTERNIVLIFDEVFVGFRLAPGGAQEYFGVGADLVTYGKTLGGGLPIGVVCGKSRLMKRFRDDRPGDICFARGTFNSHPYVMAAMNEFLRYLQTPEAAALYRDLDDIWGERARALNQRLAAERLPVEVANISSIWTVCYTQPSRYNWMLQYYLRAEGLLLTWTGTGRLAFSLNYIEADFAAVAERFVAAAKAMQADGWWWNNPAITNKTIKRAVLKEMVMRRLLPNRQR